MRRCRHIVEALTLLVLLPLCPLIRLVKALRGNTKAARIVIQGWFGSETIGDVAILGQLIQEWNAVVMNPVLSVATFHPSITRRSLRDLNYGADDVSLIVVGMQSGWCIAWCDILVFGGGPLMESKSMPFWLWRGILARCCGARVVVHGCGIGPVRTKHTETAIRWLLRVCHVAILRDASSRRWAASSLTDDKTLVSRDPAFDYVRGRTGCGRRDRSAPARIGMFLRDIPLVYSDQQDGESSRLLHSLADAVSRLAREEDIALIGFVMHDDAAESNDRDAYRQFRQLLDSPELLEVNPAFHSLQFIIDSLRTLDACITVRFHGAVFAIAAGLPLVAVDYCNPTGKVSAAAAMFGLEDRVLSVTNLSVECLLERLRIATRQQRECRRDEYSSERVRFLRARIHGP